MKIAFINLLFSMKDERGGLGAHIADLSRELSRLGHDVTVITSGVGRPYQEEGVPVVPLGKVKRYSRASQLLNPVNLIQRLVYMLRVTRYVLSGRFDVVEAAEGGFEQLFLILLRTCPVVTKLHGNFRFIYGNQTFLGRLVERFEAFVVRRSDAIYTSSLAYARTLSTAYRIPLERIRILPCGINLDELNRLKGVDVEHVFPATKNKKVVFLTVGNSPARKGAHLFIEVARRLSGSDALFVLSASRGDLLEGIDRPVNLLILPNLERSDFYNWVRRADVMVFPSEFESFAIAVREAMLLEKPIIVSRNIPLEQIEARYPRCIVLPENNSQHLESAILEMLNGRQTDQPPDVYVNSLSTKYDMRRIAEATLDLYQQAAESFGRL